MTDRPRTVVLDAEALAALAQRRLGMAERLEAARRGDHRVVIPAVVIAEVMSGSADDASVWHVLRRVPVIDLDASIAARAGALRVRAERRKKRDLTVDAIVAATALRVAPAAVLTGDVHDLDLLLEGEDVRVLSVDL